MGQDDRHVPLTTSRVPEQSEQAVALEQRMQLVEQLRQE